MSSHAQRVREMRSCAFGAGLASERRKNDALYNMAFGILVTSDLHKAYDRYEWSFFVQLTASASQDGVYYFHHFTSDKDFRPHHGTTIVGQTKWHLFEPYDWPNAELLQCEPHIHLAASLSFGADQAKFHPSGHYRQCVIANFCV
ncbi:hypothetical protein U1Q18_044779 [Sarracenia purpurea var. burkii]